MVQKVVGSNPTRHTQKFWRVNLDGDRDNLLSCFVRETVFGSIPMLSAYIIGDSSSGRTQLNSYLLTFDEILIQVVRLKVTS